MRKISQALISVTDKQKLKKILYILRKFKIKVISSGGTYKEIKKLGFKCKEVSNFTGFREILDGRVKTLHPKIHAGILNKRDKKSHIIEMKASNFEDIDLVIVNFYPFEKTLKKNQNQKQILENIDIGGPAMVRAAAKNYNYVTIITKLDQYENLIKELNQNKGSTSLIFRQQMAEEAFTETAYYDAMISNYFIKKNNTIYPSKKVISANLVEKLRYGENPHQNASLYSYSLSTNLKQLNGRKLSYNNYNDIYSAINTSKSLPKNIGCVIVKHANPCGVSVNKSKIKSFKEALNCDPVSAFGGIVSCNFKINSKVAADLSKIYFEAVIANGYEKKALKMLKKRNNLIVIDASNIKQENLNSVTSNFNTLLIQSPDNETFNIKNFKIVSKKKPDTKTMKNLIFSLNVCRHVKSNAIVLTSDSRTVGIGSGQPSRLDSCKIAIDKMNKFQKLNNNDKIIAASDAFFPFVDGIETLVQAGVSAVIQPSGSIRDKEIIKYANETGTILVFSKTRHFKH